MLLRITARIRCILIILCCLCTAYADVPPTTESLPDSLVTEDNVYRFMFSDTRLAEAIMAALRQQGELPDWELDYTEGDLYYNTGRNQRALTFYTRALDSDQARKDNTLLMDLIHRMISCYDMMHNETRKAEYVALLLARARACGDRAMEAVALFNMGKSEYNQGDKEGGCRRMEQAAQLMAGTDYEYKYDNLRYHYNTLLTYYERDRRGEDALRVLDELEQVVHASTGREKAGIDGLDEKEQKAFYGHRAVVMNLLGRHAEADECYRRFAALGKPGDRDQYVAMPYLFDRGMYDEIFRINLMNEQRLKEQGDTVNYHFTTVRRNLARAYYATGNYREAALNYAKLAVLRDSLKNREQHSAALELAEAYDSAEKDRVIMEQEAQKTLLRTVAVAIFLLAAIIITAVVLYNRKIRLRNVTLVRTVMEGQAAKNQLLELRRHHEQRIEELEQEVSHLKKRKPRATDRQVKEQMKHVLYEISARQLFLKPGLSPKDVEEELHIPTDKLNEYLKQEKGQKFIDYINELRIEYAVTLFSEYPEYTIEAIARMCGILSRQHFNKCFIKRYGISPGAFRETMKDNKESQGI